MESSFFLSVRFRLELRQPELLPNVEQDVRLTLFHLLGGHGANGAVVEVEPVPFVDGESRVVARPGPKSTKNKQSV